MTRALLLVALTAAVARITLFAEGGTVGAWASAIVFWICVGAAPVVWVRSYADARATGAGVDVRGGLGLACLAALLFVGLTDNDALETVALLAFVAALGALIVSSIRHWRANDRV